ncbi:PREDICTED: uncharacterized protein LOC104803033 [Tarenaya hassleriana]|uniref:uncharacterized protein LOC104803033 n=1 Tax=Tarenaya hassleriana TaxID=28532 RepID=UPI00053C704D|nr:PREDICTED: uncharacterized protein LOC104803033 [Tarenaya hassleriana]
MEIESVTCECCGLNEDCTQDYISEVKANFDGKWLCGLCSEAVRDEITRRKIASAAAAAEEESGFPVDQAVRAHMSFCGKFKANPAVLVADGMRQLLRRRSGDLSPAKQFGRSDTKKLY